MLNVSITIPQHRLKEKYAHCHHFEKNVSDGDYTSLREKAKAIHAQFSKTLTNFLKPVLTRLSRGNVATKCSTKEG